MLEGPWGEWSTAGTPGPWLHRLLPEQCHMTGFSLFITVFIVLDAAGLVLAGGSGVGREGSAQWGAEVLLGCWSGAQSQPLGASWCLLAPVLWVAHGGRVHCCRDGHARNAKTQRKPLLGTFQPLNRTWHFLHLPPAPGPRHARGAPETQLRYLCLYTYTYIHEQGWVRSRLTNRTKSWGRRCPVWRAVTPHTKHCRPKGSKR